MKRVARMGVAVVLHVAPLVTGCPLVPVPWLTAVLSRVAGGSAAAALLLAVLDVAVRVSRGLAREASPETPC